MKFFKNQHVTHVTTKSYENREPTITITFSFTLQGSIRTVQINFHFKASLSMIEKVYIPPLLYASNHFTGGDKMEGYSGKFLMKIEELERAGSEKALAICCGGYGTIDL